MRALAIETVTMATALGVADGDRVVEEVVDVLRHHTEALAPAAARMLRAEGLAPRALDVVVVDVGPGLFTGLRVGIAFAKGLCLATGAELHGVTSTEVLAATAFERGVVGMVLAVVDARRGEVFAGRYARGAHGPVELDAPEVLAPAELAARFVTEEVTIVGDGAVRYAEILGRTAATLLDELVVPSPAAALGLVATRRASGAPAPDPATVRPSYLREADAVANFDTRGAGA
jgi:tRNA threonylcarbamoyladenosine biosynthesis protein TsaB